MQTKVRFSLWVIIILTSTIIIAMGGEEECNYDEFLTNCRRAHQIDKNSQIYQNRSIQYYKNCLQTLEHNKKPDQTYILQTSCEAGDLTEEQNSKKKGLKNFDSNSERKTSYSPQSSPGKVSLTILPTSYNYVTMGFVTSVKDQGSCGSCWAFAAIAMYQSILLRRGFSYGLSEQAALQCTSSYSLRGLKSDCGGGYLDDVNNYHAKVGTVLRSQYPYIAGTFSSSSGYPNTPNICSQKKRISVGNGTSKSYGPLTRTQIKTLLINEGPIVIGLYANSGFNKYKSGVYTGCPSYSKYFVNHAILLVGYDDSTNSWLAKNQWGTGWGESGYIRISYDNDCGLSSYLYNIKFSNYNDDPNIVVQNLLLSSPSGQIYLVCMLWGIMVLFALI